MTREDAVEILQGARITSFRHNGTARVKEALEMAIESLKTEPTDTDLISRQATIRWVKTECNPYGKPTIDFESGKKVIKHLKQMPSADAVHGEWIMHIDDLFPEESTQECSNCHEHETIKIRSDNFCPNCGAMMLGEDGEV